MPADPSPLTVLMTQRVQDHLAGPPSMENLAAALRDLAKWRAQLVAKTVERRDGILVSGGPFKGMSYGVSASEGTRAARLLGAYEASLHPVIEAIIAKSPDLVIDIGSAEGYYAVGMALRLPQARVLARDSNPNAQKLCRALARANDVAGRVEVGGAFGPADFALCKTARSVVICDIEGAEAELLDPTRADGLLHADILVECHPKAAPGITDTLRTRFAASHKVTELGRQIDDRLLPGWMEELSDLDRLIALWEWRTGPTPWLWMEKK